MKSIRLDSIVSFLRSFYMGNVYPALICVLVLIGNLTANELLFGTVHTLLAVGALFLAPTLRPVLISILTYVYQISIEHAPKYPTYSDYFSTGYRPFYLIAVGFLIAVSLIYFFIKRGIYKKISIRKTPLLLPLLILSCSFLLGGVFSDAWTPKNLLFSFANTAIYLFAFVYIYYGLEGESKENAVKYYAYISALIALLISTELIALFLTSDNIFIDGSINKVGVALGWGIWNLVGVSLSLLIPILFVGVHKNKYPWFYFSVATVTYIMAVLTMSRNALVFATLAYAACVLISCFFGKRRTSFRIITCVGIVLVATAAVVLWDKINSVLSDYFERGFSDNGRYNLWRLAFENFLGAPVFGNGFYGFDVETAVFGPLPKMAHNTIFQLLSATGIIGLSAYLYYRIKTLIPVFRRPTLDKTLLVLSVGVVAFGSLLDNFVFNFYPMLYCNVALCLIFKCDSNEISVNDMKIKKYNLENE